jgi:AcrR family transcriptional regulator
MSPNRKEEILAGTLEAFDATGAIAIDEIRRRSGASVGSIYHHFGDQEGIAAALYVEVLREYQAGVIATLKRRTGAEEGVKALVRHHLRWVERHPQRARFLAQSGGARLAAGDELKPLNRELSASVGDWVGSRPEIRPLRSEVFYAAALGPAQELARLWLAGRIPSLRKLEDELAEAAWRAIRVGD